MEAAILENINRLYRSSIFTALLYLGLIIALILVTVGVVKFKLLDKKAKYIALISTVAVVSVGLIVLQLVKMIPIYQDYAEHSYVVVENATMIIKGDSTGGIDPVSTVVFLTDGNETKLKMQTDYSLDTETEYTGTIAYLIHSEYVVWYSVES